MRSSGCLISAWVQFSGRTVVVVQTPRLLQTANWQTLTNGLCETTAIDIYLISPHPSIVSTTSSLAIILRVFASFSSARGTGDARRPPPFTSVLSWRPTHLCSGAEEREGEGEREMERGEGQTKSFGHCGETYTSLCFHLSAGWSMILATRPRKERTRFFFQLHF